jgi:hypothetical protein
MKLVIREHIASILMSGQTNYSIGLKFGEESEERLKKFVFSPDIKILLLRSHYNPKL